MQLSEILENHTLGIPTILEEGYTHLRIDYSGLYYTVGEWKRSPDDRAWRDTSDDAGFTKVDANIRSSTAKAWPFEKVFKKDPTLLAAIRNRREILRGMISTDYLYCENIGSFLTAQVLDLDDNNRWEEAPLTPYYVTQDIRSQYPLRFTYNEVQEILSSSPRQQEPQPQPFQLSVKADLIKWARDNWDTLQPHFSEKYNTLYAHKAGTFVGEQVYHASYITKAWTNPTPRKLHVPYHTIMVVSREPIKVTLAELTERFTPPTPQEPVTMSTIPNTPYPQPTRRVLTVHVLDRDPGLDVNDSLIHTFKNVVTEDNNELTKLELVADGKLVAALKKHNTKREGIVDLEIQKRTGNEVFLRPIKLKDVEWQFVPA